MPELTPQSATDLARARAGLAGSTHTCVLCRADATLTADTPGVAPLVDWLAAGTDLRGYAAADRVVGRAAALLYLAAGVVAVHAHLASAPALELLRQAGVVADADQIVPGILNRDRTGPCPLEQAVAATSDPTEASALLQAKLTQLRQAKP